MTVLTGMGFAVARIAWHCEDFMKQDGGHVLGTVEPVQSLG